MRVLAYSVAANDVDEYLRICRAQQENAGKNLYELL
jgi:hypothetical protein